MKRIISILIIFIFLFAACSAGNDIINDEQELVSEPVIEAEKEEEPEMVHIGGVYTDTYMNMTFEINNPDWAFDKRGEREEVVFFNEHDGFEEAVISIDSAVFTGDVEQYIEDLWEQSKTFHAMIATPGVTITYNNPEQIIIGGKYTGYAYAFEFDFPDGDVVISRELFWYAGERIYQYIAAGNPQNIDEVFSVSDRILETFATIE
ncbi:MAG: hypothetical protein FWD48_04975 [Oscillospiraceae bacterium]|nr:hypothetical protein [Oscillospiraceae bacterium]